MNAIEAYDAEIEPQLMKLAERCGELGISLVALAELPSGKAHCLSQLTPRPGAAARLANVAALAKGNFDGLALMYVNDCRRRGLMPSSPRIDPDKEQAADAIANVAGFKADPRRLIQRDPS